MLDILHLKTLRPSTSMHCLILLINHSQHSGTMIAHGVCAAYVGGEDADSLIYNTDQLETLGIVSSSTERGTNDSPDSHTFSSTSSPSLQAGTSRLEHPPQSSESLATALTPSPTGYDDLTHGSPTPAPRRPRTLPRSTTVSQRDPQRSVKRSASVGLLMEVVSHAVKWWERGDGSPVKRTPLKRALSANASAVHDGSAALTRPSNLR